MDIISNIKELFFSYKKDKNIIIDPVSCLVKLSILSLYPKGTKISISNNGLSFNNSTVFQGSIRFIQGDCREDLHNIFKPIQKSIEWYWNTDGYGKTLEPIKPLFLYAFKIVSASLSANDGFKENLGREVIISVSTSCLIFLLPSKVIDLIIGNSSTTTFKVLFSGIMSTDLNKPESNIL